MVEIIEVKDKSGIKKFIEVPWLLYKDDPYWVPPLKGDLLKTLLGKDNPLFEQGEHGFFIAYFTGKPAARI
jgi:hypothetical protein